MKIEDVNQFKGKMKSAMQSWAESKVDELFANRPSARVFAKNGINNMLNRFDDKINSYIDTFFLFAADKDGIVDSDVMVDTIASLFNEMEERKYPMGMVDVTVGKGELTIELPHNLFLEMLVGNLGVVKFTSDDIKEFKNLLN